MALGKQLLRGTLEYNRDLGNPAPETFSCSQIKRNSGPPVGCNIETERCIGFGLGFGVRAILLQEAEDLLATPALDRLARRYTRTRRECDAACGTALAQLSREGRAWRVPTTRQVRKS